MYERFAAPTRRVLVEAQAEARDLGHHFIATHHLVLGLLVPDPSDSSPVRALLLAAGLTLDEARAAVLEAEPRRATAPIIGTIPFSPRSKKVLETAFRESLTRGSPEIQPEHLLLALLREGDGSGCRLLSAYGVTLAGVQSWLAGSATSMFEVFPMSPGARPMRTRPMTPMPRTTPGAGRAVMRARELAGGSAHAIGTHDLLVALLDEPEGLAYKVLSALGVTRDAVESKIAELGVTGTSDGPPPARVNAVGEAVEVRINDPELAKLLESVADAAVGDIVRQALLDHLKSGRSIAEQETPAGQDTEQAPTD